MFLSGSNCGKLWTAFLILLYGNQFYREVFMQKKITTMSLNGWWWNLMGRSVRR
jgi:hypothetical protein